MEALAAPPAKSQQLLPAAVLWADPSWAPTARPTSTPRDATLPLPSGASALVAAAAAAFLRPLGSSRRRPRRSCRTCPGNQQRRGRVRRHARAPAAELRAELLALCGEGGSRVEAAQRVEDLVQALAEAYVPGSLEESKGLLDGRWRLLSTFTPGQAAASITSLESWREYIFGRGPSPVQAATLSSGAAQRVYQAIDLASAPGRWHNVVDALPFAIFCLQADVDIDEDKSSGVSALNFQWTGGFVLLLRLPWASKDLEGEPWRLPYPVPFALLGDRARGTFETLYLDEDLRIARGVKSGSVFILARESEALPLEAEYYVPTAAIA